MYFTSRAFQANIEKLYKPRAKIPFLFSTVLVVILAYIKRNSLTVYFKRLPLNFAFL